jgi:hypothetical protein
MLSYVYFGTNDLERAIRFYDATLAPLDMPRVITGDAEWDCSSDGLVNTQLKSAPTHGSVAFVKADGYTSFPPTSPSHDCNTKKSPGIEVVYTSTEAFVGTDAFTVRGIGPRGRYMETEYTVKLVAP